MIQAILTDFSHVLLFAKDKSYVGSINDLYEEKKKDPDFDFWSVFELNQELFNFLKKMCAHTPVYIFTSRDVQNDPAIRPMLDASFAGIFVG